MLHLVVLSSSAYRGRAEFATSEKGRRVERKMGKAAELEVICDRTGDICFNDVSLDLFVYFLPPTTSMEHRLCKRSSLIYLVHYYIPWTLRMLAHSKYSTKYCEQIKSPA